MKTPSYVRLNDVYSREEDFSAALAKHLDLLSVGSFEEGETEALVGTRRADIVAQGDDGVLVIECQFGKADWDHWGRLEAYARLKEATTAALVAEDFEELMVVTCELRNADSEVGWWLVKAQATDQREFIFQTIAGPKIDIQTERSGREYSEFWAPIRASGFFAGKPLQEGDSWIGKSVRGVQVHLFVYKNFSKVEAIWPIDRIDERDMFLEHMKELGVETRETPKVAFISVPVMDKGQRHTEHWDEIRQKLVHTGEVVFRIVSEAPE